MSKIKLYLVQCKDGKFISVEIVDEYVLQHLDISKIEKIQISEYEFCTLYTWAQNEFEAISKYKHLINLVSPYVDVPEYIVRLAKQ